MKQNFNKKQIEEMLKNSTEEIIEDDENLIDERGNVFNVDKVIDDAETCIQKKYS